jgi:hypothetical protein
MPKRGTTGASERSKKARRFGAVESRKRNTPPRPSRNPSRKKEYVTENKESKAAKLRADARRHTAAVEKGVKKSSTSAKAQANVDYSIPERELKNTKLRLSSKTNPKTAAEIRAAARAKAKEKGEAAKSKTAAAAKKDKATDKGKMSAFGKAFAKARAEGRKTFEHNGNEYTTKRADDKPVKTPPKPARKPKKPKTTKYEASGPPKDLLKGAKSGKSSGPSTRKARGKKTTARGKRILTPRRTPRSMRPER